MFSSEVKVNGVYVKGSIKLDSGYVLLSELNFGNSKEKRWSASDLDKMAKELTDVADKIEELNAPECR